MHSLLRGWVKLFPGRCAGHCMARYAKCVCLVLQLACFHCVASGNCCLLFKLSAEGPVTAARVYFVSIPPVPVAVAPPPGTRVSEPLLPLWVGEGLNLFWAHQGRQQDWPLNLAHTLSFWLRCLAPASKASWLSTGLTAPSSEATHRKGISSWRALHCSESICCSQRSYVCTLCHREENLQ